MSSEYEREVEKHSSKDTRFTLKEENMEIESRRSSGRKDPVYNKLKTQPRFLSDNKVSYLFPFY